MGSSDRPEPAPPLPWTAVRLPVRILLYGALAAGLPVALAALLDPGDLCGANETAAIATLRNLVSAEGMFQGRPNVDLDGDGIGEFGTFREMTGSVPLRAPPGTPPRVLAPPMLSASLAGVTTEGWVAKSGYAFALFLPRKGGGWVRETGEVRAGPAGTETGCRGGSGAAPGGTGVSAEGIVDPDRAEREWVAIAWPRMVGRGSRRVFLVTASGNVLQAANQREISCGTVLPEGPADVLPPGWKPGDEVAGGYRARSGEEWKVTN